MQKNPVVIQHFQDLVNQGDRVKATYVPSSDGQGIFHDTEFSEWITSCLTLISSIFGEQSVILRQFQEYEKDKYVFRRFSNCWGALKSAKVSYENGYATKLDAMVRAEVFDDVLDQAQALLDNNYKDAAGVVARVALENALKDLSNRHNVSYGKLDTMNADLTKAGVYNKSQQKFVTAWAGRGNDAAHGLWDSYNAAEVKEMIDGVRLFIATYL